MRGLIGLLCTTALLAPLALAPKADAQIAITVGGPPPICPYGYYGYAPYSCAPVGYYGSGYFYNGIFLGLGPWAGWGYDHGWGGHRFVNAGGGRYTGGFVGYHENHGSTAIVHTNGNESAYRSGYAAGANTAAGHNNQPHAAPTHYSQPHSAPVHNNQPHNAPNAEQGHGGQPHGGGSEPHGEGGEHH
jgi:hypothetical protein